MAGKKQFRLYEDSYSRTCQHYQQAQEHPSRHRMEKMDWFDEDLNTNRANQLEDVENRLSAYRHRFAIPGRRAPSGRFNNSKLRKRLAGMLRASPLTDRRTSGIHDRRELNTGWMEPHKRTSESYSERDSPYLFCDGYRCATAYPWVESQEEQPVDCVGSNCPSNIAKRFVCPSHGCGKRQVRNNIRMRMRDTLSTPTQLDNKRKFTCEPMCMRLKAQKRNLFCNINGCRLR